MTQEGRYYIICEISYWSVLLADDGTTTFETSGTAHRTTLRQVPQFLHLRAKLPALTVMIILQTSTILKGTELVPVQFECCAVRMTRKLKKKILLSSTREKKTIYLCRGPWGQVWRCPVPSVRRPAVRVQSSSSPTPRVRRTFCLISLLLCPSALLGAWSSLADPLKQKRGTLTVVHP